MKKFLLFLFITISYAQGQEHAWVYFKDKPDVSVYTNNPTKMLSARALERRAKQNIALDERDVPVDTNYILEVANSEGIALEATSKWLNAVHVFGSETAIFKLLNLTFVASIQFASKNVETTSLKVTSQNKVSKINKVQNQFEYAYGAAENQIKMIGADMFHNLGYQGQGMQIAILDLGFSGVKTANAFGHLLDSNLGNGEILGGYDFVHSSNNFYRATETGVTHGTQVLSTIAAIKENEFVGTAPKASFYLFVTEDDTSETPLEESLWVQAAERADSLGVDIINSSLGYNEFDEDKYNYSYEDMDGETTFITKGANIAIEKGMLLVNSIGNSGNNTWKYLTAPADAKNSIAVGAVAKNESLASFSSFGPTADERIKPETLACGESVYVVNENNEVVLTNGTSFSSPIVAGTVACLWQAYPKATNLEIRQMIIEHSENFYEPTDQGGYGILRIESLASELLKTKLEYPFYITTFHNGNVIGFYFYNEEEPQELKVQVFSVLGNVLVDKKITPIDNLIQLNNYASGIYYLRYQFEGNNELMTLIKGE